MIKLQDLPPRVRGQEVTRLIDMYNRARHSKLLSEVHKQRIMTITNMTLKEATGLSIIERREKKENTS